MISAVRSRSLPMLVAALAASTAMLVSALVIASPARADDAWTQLGIDIDGEAAGDGSGSAVAMSADGSSVAIGAPGNGAAGISAGQVRVYTLNGGTWTQRGSDIDGANAYDSFGLSVAMSADGATVAIGAPNNDASGNNAGQVRVYSWNGSTWTQQGGVINGEAANDGSGYSVAMSADGATVAIGARFNGGGGSGAGQVRVYALSGSTWTQRGSDINGEAASDFSGWSVAMSADGATVAIGAPNNNSGQVRVYSWNGSTWSQRGSDMDGEAAYDQSGVSVALSADGTIVAIGARYNSGSGSNAGQVRVYAWNGSTWTQRGSDIDGEAGDESGSSVAISSDGTTVAIGAPYNSGNGFEAGQARIYIWSGSSWTQRGSDIDGEATGDRSGKPVALSADGATVAIGAPSNDSNSRSSAGQVRVFTWLVAPVITGVSPGDTSAAVAFTADDSGGSTITRLEFALDDTMVVDDSIAPPPPSSSYTLSNLSPRTAYTVYMRAVNAVGAGPWSAPQGFVTSSPPIPPPVFPPGAPTSALAVAGDRSASVSWVAPSDSESYPISTYQVTSSPSGRSCLVSVPVLTCTVSGLTNGASYTFTVRALNGAGWGSDSLPSNAVTPRATPKPSMVITGSRDASDTRVVRVTGTTTDLIGEQVTPWLRFTGQTTFTAGAGVRTVAADGAFEWSRATGKKVHVYFTHGSIKSNTVVIPAR